MAESEIVKACLDLLEALRRQGKPIIATRTNAGMVKTVDGRWIKLCDDGWPDITCTIAGKAVGIECKRARDAKQRKTQAEMQAKWEAAGGIYLLSPGLEVVREYLREKGML